MNLHRFIKAGKTTAEIRICTVRDTSEAPQKPVNIKQTIFKKVYFVFRYGLCKFKMRVLTNHIIERSTCRGEFLHEREEAFRKKISEVIK